MYGVDDGSPALEISVAMLEMAAAAGTTDIVGTPHASVEFPFDRDLVSRRFHQVKSAAPPGIRVHLGCDFHLQHDNVVNALASPRKYTVNGGRYLLVELSDLAIFKNTEEVYERLMNAGITLIITHPERNPLLRQRIDRLQRWSDMGCYLQVTGGSLLGRFGSKAQQFSRVLLDAGLVHFIASDGHDLKHRPPTLDAARAWLTKHYGDDAAALLLVHNPGQVIRDEAGPLQPVEGRRRKRWFSWFR